MNQGEPELNSPVCIFRRIFRQIFRQIFKRIFALWIVVSFAGCTTTSTESGPAQKWNNDKRAEIHVKLGMSYLQRGQLHVARSEIELALALKNNYAPAHHAMALLQQKFGDARLARKHYVRAAKLDAESFRIRNDYGQFLCAQGQTEDGVAQFYNALENPLNIRRDLSNLGAGQCHVRGENWKTAEQYLRTALKINPGLRQAIYSLVRASFELGEYLSARAYLERFLQRSRPTAELLLYGFQIEKRLGADDTAQRYAKRLRNLFPESREARRLSALIPAS